MFNALLGGFVAWSLTAGALPGPWPAAASLALGGALLLLHGHTHGAALTVDVLARRSRFLTVNPGLKLWCCAALLALCLLVVFRVLPYLPVLLCVAAVVVALDRSLFRSVDYFLLLTFLCFFLFLGNIKRIPEISNVLTQLVSGRELWAGILASQVISNVPAAILLAEFAQDLPTLITAVNLGGLGTLIASLASLISFQLFARDYPEKKGVFLKAFTGWNLVFLLVLSAAAVVLTGL